MPKPLLGVSQCLTRTSAPPVLRRADFNSAIHNKADHWNMALVGERQAKKAVAVSRAYGNADAGFKYSGPDAHEQVMKGKEEMKAVGILTKKDGWIDKRCQAVRGGQISVRDGEIYGLKERYNAFQAMTKEGPMWKYRNNYDSDDD